MRKAISFRVLGAVAAAGVLALASAPWAVGASTPPSYTCKGGDLPSGTYASVTVTGMCQVPADGSGVIHILGNLNLAAGALFDAQSSPSTITVGHNVTAAPGSLLGLGCQPDTDHAQHACANDPEGASTITVNGNITTTDADTVLLNGLTVRGNVTLTGGGGEIPWAEKNNVIGGNLTVSDVTADWIGVLFNHVGRNAVLTDLTSTDPEDESPPVSVVQNHVGWNLICHGLGPSLSGGFVPGAVNVVGHKAIGQCAALV